MENIVTEFISVVVFVVAFALIRAKNWSIKAVLNCLLQLLKG